MTNDEPPKTDRSQQYLANERTFLSWVRTSIALVGLGFIISKFSFFLKEFRLVMGGNTDEINELAVENSNFSLDQISNWIGIGVVFLAVILISLALKNYIDIHKSITTQSYYPNHRIIYTTSVIIIVLSIIVFIYLLYVPNS
ncbi:MAG: DUF202 domain-containing protein [Thermoproteota archaeon]|nr:DUF202 domain-containing protein [Thermoproteota archaeon]